MQRLPKVLVFVGIVSLVSGLFFIDQHKVRSATADHVVISEIQIAGAVAVDDEFIELYNPTNNPINLAGWQLKRLTSGGTSNNLIASMSGTVAAHGYYLLGHPSYSGVMTADAFYADSPLAVNNTVILYHGTGTTVEDMVGLNTAKASESASIANPPAGGSVERKAKLTSVLALMIPGGLDALEGNGEDTDNNAADFVVRPVSDPQNSTIREGMGDATKTVVVNLNGGQEVPPASSSATGIATVEIKTDTNVLSYTLSYQGLSGAETMAHIHGPAASGFNAGVAQALQTGSPKDGAYIYSDAQEPDLLNNLYYMNIHSSALPDGEIRGQIVFNEVTPTPTLTPEPTVTPTQEPTPTVEPTVTLTPSPTATVTPAPTPTLEPTVWLSPTPTTAPTVTPKPTPPGSFKLLTVTCQTKYNMFRIFNQKVYIPYIVCGR